MCKLVDTIRSCVQPSARPCVNISGGIDSAIVLHHLTEKCKEPIHTYTVAFTGQDNELEHGKQLAEHYGTVHHEIVIDNLLDRYPEILSFMDRPRFNLWPFYVAEQQAKDGMLNCYIGEGGDEHFGGYWYLPQMSYPEIWAHLFQYVDPTYQQVYDHFKIRLHKPLHPCNLRFNVTYPFYDHDQEKRLVREAYRGILPDFVIENRKLNGRKDYWVIWHSELKKRFPTQSPKSERDVQDLLNLFVTREWLKSHEVSEKEVMALRVPPVFTDAPNNKVVT